MGLFSLVPAHSYLLIRTYDLLEMRRDESPYSHITSFAIGALSQLEEYSPQTLIQRGMVRLVRGELQFCIRRYSSRQLPLVDEVTNVSIWSLEKIRDEFQQAVADFVVATNKKTVDAFEAIFCALSLDRLLVILFFMHKAKALDDEGLKNAITELEVKWHYSQTMDVADKHCPSWSRALNTAELHAVRGETWAAGKSYDKAKKGNPKLDDILRRTDDDTAWASKWLRPIIERDHAPASPTMEDDMTGPIHLI
jgi:hypothetical protein